MTWYCSSRLAPQDVLKILSQLSSSEDAFLADHIRGRNVMDVASGGFTEVVEFFRSECGANAALSVDITPLKCWQRPSMYLKADAARLAQYLGRIKRKLEGNRPDTIFVTSVFGTLSGSEARDWITAFCKVVSPKGFIFVDLLLYGDARHMDCDEFEDVLQRLVKEGPLHSWEGAPEAIHVRYRGWLRGVPRPCSLTYRLKARLEEG